MSPRRSGAVFDPRLWLQVVLSAGVGAFLMAVMLPGLALLRDTTGHDWYAAGKLTLDQAIIASGFDRDASTQYRTAEGETETLTRYRMTFQGEALWARSRIVSTALRHAVLGIPAGAVLAMFFVILWTHGRSSHGHPGENRPTRKNGPPSGAWNRADCVEGVLRLDGRAPVGVVVVPPMGAGQPAQVYGSAGGRAALPGAQDGPVVEAPPVKRTRALPAPAPESGHAEPGSATHDSPPGNLPVRSKPRPAAPRGRKKRTPARPKPGKGKLWF